MFRDASIGYYPLDTIGTQGQLRQGSKVLGTGRRVLKNELPASLVINVHPYYGRQQLISLPPVPGGDQQLAAADSSMALSNIGQGSSLLTVKHSSTSVSEEERSRQPYSRFKVQ